MKEPVKLCHCCNCGKLFIDAHPSKDSITYQLDASNIPLLPLLQDAETMYYGCDVCNTDDYIVDNVIFINK